MVNGVSVSGVGVEVAVVFEVVVFEVVGKGTSVSVGRVGVKQVGAEVDLGGYLFLGKVPKLIPLGVLYEKEEDVGRGLFVIKNFTELLSSSHIFNTIP